MVRLDMRRGHVTMSKGSNEFEGSDPLLLDGELSQAERMGRDAARDYCRGKLAPRVVQANREERFDRRIMNEMGELGLLGSTIRGYGCAGVNHVSYGLGEREVARLDAGNRPSMTL